MKTKQAKEELDKSIEDETQVIEPKTRARKKASDISEEEKNKPSQDEPKTSKDTKKSQPKPKAVVKKRPLGIRKALRSKKPIAVKEKVKNVIKQTVKRGRKRAIKTEPDNSQDKEAVPLIPASEIKKEPAEDTTPNSRSSSPKTAGRRPRVSSDMAMMKTMLSDSPSTLVLGPRTSPYSMRSERSNSPSLFEAKNLRSGKPRKAKANLLNEVVMKEQKKRRRLISDSKNSEAVEGSEDCKKLKRGRSCSREGSEISKCSDNTESDLSLSETLNDSESIKKVDKSKTDLDVDIENNVQISTIEKVPSLNVDSKVDESKLEKSPVVNEKNKKLSLKRSTSLDSDNNNSNRIKLETLNSSDVEDKLSTKTENDTLFEARSSVLTSMSKRFNSKEMSKNLRRARRGKKALAEARRPNPNLVAKNFVPSTITSDPTTELDDKHETIETLSKDIDDLIKNLDQNIDRDHEFTTEVAPVTTPISLSTVATVTESTPEQMETKSVAKFYSLNKPLSSVDDNTIIPPLPETPVKDRDVVASIENTPSKIDDSENIRLHYEEDSVEKSDAAIHTITYKCSTVASIDKLMDRLKEFEEFDKRRQRQESESKSTDSKPMMVTNDVVLIPKSGADIKPLKDIQSVRSPEKPLEKENVLSCFENNSAISIVKRDQVRKSIDVDLPNSVTLIKRKNSVSARKESTSSNHSRESDAITIFEKSFGKDVTLTEIRKSVDKSGTPAPVDLHQFATLHPNSTSQIGGVLLDSSQISITPRVSEVKMITNDVIITKRKSRESMSQRSSESTNDTEDKMATIEKIKSPTHQSPAISITPAPVAIKSPEPTPVEAVALPPSVRNVKPIDEIHIASETPKPEIKPEELPKLEVLTEFDVQSPPKDVKLPEVLETVPKVHEKMEVDTKLTEVTAELSPEQTEPVIEKKEEVPVCSKPSEDKPVKSLEEITPAKVPQEIAPSKIPEEIAPAKGLKIVTPAINPEEITPSKTEKITPGKAPEEITPSKGSDEIRTAKSPDEITIAKGPQEITPPKASEEVTPAEGTEKITSAKSLGEITPGKDRGEITPVKGLGEITPAKGVGEITPAKGLGDLPPAKGPGRPKARISTENQPGPSYAFNETPETQKHKENVLRTLGLLTHKAAKEAKIEKLREKERIYSGMLSNKGKAAKSSGDYTGTLKTVIKLNRNIGDRDKKKHRSSLKMTFQKSKYRSGKPVPDMGEAANEDATFYTIERREGAGPSNADDEAIPEPVEAKETLNLVIPEKASSFSIHPGRLCMDQCFYCGGKFGLFDTPCHIAQIKSSERQKKILDNEEKLTIDSCLCDACYRHVDRRANCPSYRKRPLPRTEPPPPPPMPTESSEKTLTPAVEEESEDERPALAPGRISTCHTEGCAVAADHSIRRKWLIKMRSSVNKVLKLKGDYPGLHTIPLCAAHHRALAPLMQCVLCRRRLTKHHNLHFIHHGYTELNPLLLAASLPVQFSERPVLCKSCRYYCSLLQRPAHNPPYERMYRRKLLQIYNIEVPPDQDGDIEDAPTQHTDDSINKQKKKQRNKSKQRKSTEPESNSSETSEKTNESSTPEKKETESSEEKPTPVEEDIESLISSNRILVPGVLKPNEANTSDGSENEAACEIDVTPHIHVDKQTELQYLLQKQNNPAQFIQNQPNLTNKQKNLLKLHMVSGKPGHQHRISEKNAKKIQKIGQMLVSREAIRKDEIEIFEEKTKDAIPGIPIVKNMTINEECTIESIPNKRPADINTLKNKWQMSESFTQVKRNLSELSKKLSVEKEPSKKPTEVKYTNPVKRLETNPSISVRELFPGEEEMNLQCNVEFNNVKGVTPEGWEKCNTMIQYDVETKKLWNELQRPYGNQSSFLRHLILLEKYFRSGDLVLSHNASPHAANYSDSVQSRLRAYDNVVNDAPRRSEPAISLIEFRRKPSSMNGKSLLKSNQAEQSDLKKFMPPPSSTPKTKSKEKVKNKQLPPELIAINTPNAQGRKAIQNVLHNIQQLVKGVSASDPTEVAAAPLPPPKFEPPKYESPKFEPPKYEPPKEKKEAPKEKKEAPKADTPKKIKASSKPWRPTLMPITAENLSKIAREPTQVAVDGRSLPSLVQVMSSGKRYHITLQDYNKMCIMRREKLQQLQDGDRKRPSTEETTVVTELPPSAMLGNGGSVTQISSEEKSPEKIEMPQIGSNAATILKNVGLKNITIAPISAKTSTVTSQMLPLSTVTSPSLIMTANPIRIPQLSSSVTITSETVLTPNLPMMTSQMIMPKIPKSLTVIPQTVVTSVPQNVVVTGAMPTQIVPASDARP